MKLGGQKVRFNIAEDANGPRNRHAKRQVLGALKRARRQAAKQKARAIKRGFGKQYDALFSRDSATSLHVEGPVGVQVPVEPETGLKNDSSANPETVQNG